MAETTAIISSAGGIIAGTPFALGAATFVQQVTPPVVNTSRLVLLGGAWAGISAPGLFAGAHSFVLGEDVEDSAAGVRAILIGYKIRQNTTAATADDQVLIGHDIQIPLAALNSQNIVALGATIAFVVGVNHNSFGGNVLVGTNVTVTCSALADAIDGVVIGAGATMLEGKSVVIGANAAGSGDESVTIGVNSGAGGQGVAVGAHAVANSGGGKGVAVGNTAKASDSCVAIGYQADTSAVINAIALGRGATPPGNNVFIVGSAAVPMIVWMPATDAVCDLGDATTHRFKDFHLTGVVSQVGANGAAANAAAIVNAPTAKAFQWVPFTFNAAPGWLLWQPA